MEKEVVVMGARGGGRGGDDGGELGGSCVQQCAQPNAGEFGQMLATCVQVSNRRRSLHVPKPHAVLQSEAAAPEVAKPGVTRAATSASKTSFSRFCLGRDR
jgi:hypothetical protein